MSRPKILIVHNRYRFSGGEDTVVETEASLLRAYGHEVEEYFDSNEALTGESGLQIVSNLLWSTNSARSLARLLRGFKPDIVHCHNTFYRISPSVYWLCRRMGIPVVQTLHNFRLGCANARLIRNGTACELCLTSPAGFLHGVRYGCFQDSALKTLALAGSVAIHARLGTYSDLVSAYICLCWFARQKHILSGLPEEKLVVKPNCVYPDPGLGDGQGSFCLFAGRLEADKGVRVLLDAATRTKIPVWVVGQGPLESEVRLAEASTRNLRYLGPLPRERVLDLMKSARLMIVPSLAYENFPMTIVEALSVGLPVIASRQGAPQELVEDTITGLHYEPLSSSGLAQAIERLWQDRDTLQRMRVAARARYETAYSGEATYQALLSIYGRAMAGHPATTALA